MRIQELAKLTGLSTHTIRFYEKEGLLDKRYIIRKENNYRDYLDGILEWLQLIKKFQRIGCSLTEIKVILKDKDTNTLTNKEIMDWICQKISEVEHKKQECEQILVTLNSMLEYRKTLENLR